MTHNCDLCGTKTYISLPQYPAAAVCTSCGFVYVRERRTSEEIAKAWDDIWGASYSSEWPAVQARLYYVAEYLDQTIGLAKKTVCDIGAGEGTFLRFAWERGALIFGIEPDAKNCNLLSAKDISYFHGPVEAYDTSAKFDIVTINWTLENTGDCMAVLRKARDMLAPDGHICVATGSRILVPFKKPLHTYFSGHPPDLHCFRWSANSLTHALVRAGFGAVDYNDYEVNDWLLAVAQPSVAPPASFTRFLDEAQEVLDHFKTWEATWP